MKSLFPLSSVILIMIRSAGNPFGNACANLASFTTCFLPNERVATTALST